MLFMVRTSAFSCRICKTGIWYRTRNYLWSHRAVWSRESATIPIPNIYSIGWYLFDAPARFLVILICPQHIIDIFQMIVSAIEQVLSENRRQMSECRHYPRIGMRDTISTPGPLNEESGFVQRGPKKGDFFFFPRKLSPQEKQLSRACESRPPSDLPSKYSPVQHRSEYRAATADEQADLFVGNASRVFPGSFPSSPSREHRRRRSRLTCCRITGSTLTECPLASYLSSSPYLALPGSLFNPRPGRAVKSHESWRNTTVKLKRSKTPWLSWWHCNKIATCSFSTQGLGY